MDEITRKEYQIRSDYKQWIATKIRMTAQEFGEDGIKDAVLIGDFLTWDDGGRIAGFECIDAPTISNIRLGRVSYKVARFFENIILPKENKWIVQNVAQ